MKNNNYWYFICLLLGAIACGLPHKMGIFPAYFPPTQYDFKQNPLQKHKVLLGRILFYDPILSKDNSISCASCHSPYNAFAHTDHSLSHGINDQIGTRNAPALMNLAWQQAMMWDGAIQHLDMQALAPISHPKEMASDIGQVVAKLQHTPLYPPLFAQAFGDSTISGENVLKALAQFQLTLVSANAKYDSVMRHQSVFNEQEQRGYQLFKQHCAVCHSEPLFSTYGFANNGLPIDTALRDYGKMAISKNSADSLKFKIPTLRNWLFTAPYMHDGRFKKIGEVLNHYSHNIQQSPTLATVLQKGIALTAKEKVDITVFLMTLNDKHFVFNPDLAFPKAILPAKKP